MISTLNKELFNRSIPIIGLKIQKSLLKNFNTEFKGLLLIKEKVKHIIDSDSNDKKVVLLKETFKNENELPIPLKEYINKNEIQVVNHNVNLTFDNFSYEDVMKESLPEGSLIPYAFEKIGHIAHLNLRDELLPFKTLIGQIILEKKGPSIRTVLNKVGKIDTVFRTFTFELLAGENDLMTEIKENECLFKFNFSQVYWNSRLATEHGRLVRSFKPSDVVCDMFAGVGPFALPAVKLNKSIIFHANDLNPSSIQYMKENIKLNRIDEKRLHVYNMDAREFVRKLLVESNPPVAITQVIMNLPMTSIEFLDVFRELFLDPIKPPPIESPMIHCYTFTKTSDSIVADTKKNVENVLNHTLDNTVDMVKIEEVRDVSPNKRMMRISFKMPTILKFKDTTTTSTTNTLKRKEIDGDVNNNNNQDNNNNNNSKVNEQEEDCNKKLKL